VYLPPGTTFQYKFLRKEPNGTVRIFCRHSPSFLGPVCAKMTFTDLLDGCAWVDHVGIGPDQGGYDSGVGIAVDCDELELSDDAPDRSRIFTSLF
jgi:hypothetical protein